MSSDVYECPKIILVSSHIMFISIYPVHCANSSLSDVGKLSMLYLDHNNLTTIHKEWFENFHTRWTREQHGQIFLDPNPWVCDCSSTDFHKFQIDNEFFHDKYSRDEGYVSLGSCQYPHSLRGKKFEDLTMTDVDGFICQPPRILGKSEGKVKVEKGEEEMVWVTVDGAPPPMVEFIVRDASVSRNFIQLTPKKSRKWLALRELTLSPSLGIL